MTEKIILFQIFQNGDGFYERVEKEIAEKLCNFPDVVDAWELLLVDSIPTAVGFGDYGLEENRRRAIEASQEYFEMNGNFC